MNYLRYLNDACQSWQERPWMKLGAVCPYWTGHANRRPQLKFVKNSLFRRYCSNHPKLFKTWEKYPPYRGGSQYKHNKLYKLYWRLHPEFERT